MGYRNLDEVIADLRRTDQLRVIDAPIDPVLQMGVIQRRVYAADGPALLFANPLGSGFPMLGNLFGTLERTRWLFRDALPAVERLVQMRRRGLSALGEDMSGSVRALWRSPHLLPRIVRNAPVLRSECRLSALPRLVSWPRDGGAFVTLPQVYSEHPDRPGWRHSNLGMYRVQLDGNQYADDEVGLHYQIHRGIGVHHQAALERRQGLPVNVFVGGPPSMTLAAVMPLPEGMPELAFAGMLGGHRLELARRHGHLPVAAQADFCISGTLWPGEVRPEGPFGDHLGYYSLEHPFPVLRVERVFHRPGAIWPFTTVGRPPQEDTSFGAFIHELTGDLLPELVPGLRAVHAVDAAGVHPLLLAIGSERYVPWEDESEPRELLTIASALLGQGQLSLAKYLLIVRDADNPELDIQDVGAFLVHLLERVDLRRDLHFHTRTTADTLDYSARGGINRGSKLVMAAAGRPRRTLAQRIPGGLHLPAGFADMGICLPGVLAIQAPVWSQASAERDQQRMLEAIEVQSAHFDGIVLAVLVDDLHFVRQSLDNLLWVLFTRSDPAADSTGLRAEVVHKHWGCDPPLVIDARFKDFQAAPLEMDPAVERLVDEMAVRGGPLEGLF